MCLGRLRVCPNRSVRLVDTYWPCRPLRLCRHVHVDHYVSVDTYCPCRPLCLCRQVMFFSLFFPFFPLLFSETHAPVDRLCMGREGRGAALSSLHLVRCLRLQWLCLRWPDNVRAPDLNWWDSIDCVRRRPGSVYTWFQLFTSHWLCQKTTWTNIPLGGTDEIPLTVFLKTTWV